MTQEEQQGTHDGEAVVDEVQFDREDVESVGDDAAASVDTDPGPAGLGPEPVGESPAAADRRASEQAESPPFAAIGGAFVGAFVAAKLLGKLGGDDD